MACLNLTVPTKQQDWEYPLIVSNTEFIDTCFVSEWVIKVELQLSVQVYMGECQGIESFI